MNEYDQERPEPTERVNDERPLLEKLWSKLERAQIIGLGAGVVTGSVLYALSNGGVYPEFYETSTWVARGELALLAMYTATRLTRWAVSRTIRAVQSQHFRYDVWH